MKAEDLEEDEESTVMPQYTNVAKGKVTSQSSTQSDGVSSRAVDGWEDATAWNLYVLDLFLSRQTIRHYIIVMSAT